MLKCAANQNMTVTPRNRITPLGQHNGRQKVFGALVQNHLPLNRHHRQLNAKGFHQLTTPGPGCEHYLIGMHITTGRMHTRDASIFVNKPRDRTLLMQRDVWHLLQRRSQRLDQSRVAHIGYIRHLHRPPTATPGPARSPAATPTRRSGRPSRCAQASASASSSRSSQYNPVTYTSGSICVCASNCSPKRG